MVSRLPRSKVVRARPITPKVANTARSAKPPREGVVSKVIAGISLTVLIVEFFSYVIAYQYFKAFDLDPSQAGISPLNAAQRMLSLTPILVFATTLAVCATSVYRAISDGAKLAAATIDAAVRNMRRLRDLEVEIRSTSDELRESVAEIEAARADLSRIMRLSARLTVRSFFNSDLRTDQNGVLISRKELWSEIIKRRRTLEEARKAGLKLTRKGKSNLRRVKRLNRSFARSRWIADRSKWVAGRLGKLSRTVSERSIRRYIALAGISIAVSIYYFLYSLAATYGSADRADFSAPATWLELRVVGDLRPKRYSVEYVDPARIPLSLKSVTGRDGKIRQMLLLGSSGGQLALLEPVSRSVFMVPSSQVILTNLP